MKEGREISCGVCHRCRELLYDDGSSTGACIYGGPYPGYRMPDGTTETVEKINKKVDDNHL